MFNKKEVLGILVSIVLMAVTLFYLRSETGLLNIPGQDELIVNKVNMTTVINATSPAGAEDLREALLAATTPDGVIKQFIIADNVLGAGDEVVDGDTVSVNYIGTLQNGVEFDNSYKRGQPFSFTVGQGMVIKGWDEGLVGMKVGGKRTLIIPSDKAYGSNGYGPIPGGATLIFVIELVEIK